MNCRVPHDARASLPSRGTFPAESRASAGPGGQTQGRQLVTGSWDPGPWDQRLLWD